MPSISERESDHGQGHEHGPGCGCIGHYFGLLVACVVVGVLALVWWVWA